MHVTVFRWFRKFMSGTGTLEDDDRNDRMATTVARVFLRVLRFPPLLHRLVVQPIK